MATKAKMKKVEDQKPQILDPKEFKQIKELFEIMNKISGDIVNLEVNKNLAVGKYLQAEGEFGKIKEKLTYKYGDIHLDMATGTFTIAEKEEEDGQPDTEN